MVWFKRITFVLAIPLLLMGVLAVLSGTMEYSKLQSEVAALGPYRGQLDQLQSDAVWRWMRLAAGLAALPFIIIVIVWWFKRPVRESAAAPPVKHSTAAAPPVKHSIWRIYLVVLWLLLLVAAARGVRGYLDYTEACNTLHTLLPVYEKSEKALKVARDNEQLAQQEWQIVNDIFLALVAKEDTSATKLVEIVAVKTTTLTKARGERELEELVLEKILHEVTFYKRLAQQSAPWYIITMENK